MARRGDDQHLGGRTLRLDDGGDPYFAFQKTHLGWSAALSYGYRVAGVFRGQADPTYFDLVHAQHGSGRTPSLAFDALGNPMIAYATSSPDAVRLARWNGSTWTTEPIQNGARTPVAMDVDSAGTPTVAFEGSGTNSIIVARDTGDWEFVTVDSDRGAYGGDIDITVDGSNGVHVLYWQTTGAGTGEVVYAKPTGTDTWSLESVATGWNLSGLKDIEVSSDGTVHALYLDGQSGELLYGRKNAGAWETELVTIVDRRAIGSVEMALDSSGSPHLLIAWEEDNWFHYLHGYEASH